MSAITIDSDLVHYEVLGRGRPVIFVHGWLGSWRFWVPTMQHLSVKYRTYALDLWGFGDSGKDVNKYGMRDQVALLFGFFERLGIPKAALIGHSLGAAVALNFARQYPDRVYRLMLISLPLSDQGGLGEDSPAAQRPTSEVSVVADAKPVSANSTSGAERQTQVMPTQQQQFSSTSETIPRNPFRTRGESPEDIMARLRSSRGAAMPPPVTPPSDANDARNADAMLPPRPAGPLLPTSIGTPILPSVPAPIRPEESSPLLAAMGGSRAGALFMKFVNRDVPDLDTLRVEADKADENALIRSAQSLAAVNLALELKRLAAPTLLLHGEDDSFIVPPAYELLQRINVGKQAGHFLPLLQPALRHFPMLEAMNRFNRLLMDFLEAPDLANIQFKDQWKRSMR